MVKFSLPGHTEGVGVFVALVVVLVVFVVVVDVNVDELDVDELAVGDELVLLWVVVDESDPVLDDVDAAEKDRVVLAGLVGLVPVDDPASVLDDVTEPVELLFVLVIKLEEDAGLELVELVVEVVELVVVVVTDATSTDPFTYNCNRFPAPQYSVPSPGHVNEQSLWLSALTLPVLSWFPQ